MTLLWPGWLDQLSHLSVCCLYVIWVSIGLAVFPRARESKSQGPSILQVFACVTFPIVSLAKNNHNGVITHLEPHILESKVEWALGSITMNKASGVDGIPAELFTILNNDAVKVLHSICQQIWKTQHWQQDWKTSVFIPIPKKGNVQECSNYWTITLISHVSKVMLKILQGRLQ